MGNLFTARVGNILTAPMGNVLTAGVGKVLDICSYAVTERIVEPERAAALAGVAVEEFVKELGEVF